MLNPQCEANKRYRKKYPERRRAERNRNYQKTAGPKKNFNWKQPWTAGELKLLNSLPITDRELHKLIGRSVASIQVMRAKLKKEERKDY